MEPVDIIIFWELWEQNKKHFVLKKYKRLTHRSLGAFSLHIRKRSLSEGTDEGG